MNKLLLLFLTFLLVSCKYTTIKRGPYEASIENYDKETIVFDIEKDKLLLLTEVDGSFREHFPLWIDLSTGLIGIPNLPYYSFSDNKSKLKVDKMTVVGPAIIGEFYADLNIFSDRIEIFINEKRIKDLDMNNYIMPAYRNKITIKLKK